MNYELKVHEVHGEVNLNLKEDHLKKNLHNPASYTVKVSVALEAL